MLRNGFKCKIVFCIGEIDLHLKCSHLKSIMSRKQTKQRIPRLWLKQTTKVRLIGIKGIYIECRDNKQIYSSIKHCPLPWPRHRILCSTILKNGLVNQSILQRFSQHLLVFITSSNNRGENETFYTQADVYTFSLAWWLKSRWSVKKKCVAKTMTFFPTFFSNLNCIRIAFSVAIECYADDDGDVDT